MIDFIHLPTQLVPHWVERLVSVHLRSQVVSSGQVLEAVEVVPVPGSTATWVMIYHLSSDGGVYTVQYVVQLQVK